jgi:hypothetical protein
MPTPTATKTLADVSAYVKRQFGDESGVQITDADITRWVNQAQTEIVNKNPIIQATGVTNTVVGTQTYDIPPDMIQLESIFVDGMIMEQSNFETIRAQLGNDANTQGNPQYWYVWANKIYLWPTPSQVWKLETNYSKMPNRVSSSADVLGVPDRYFDRVCEYAMAKAYELDEDWSAHAVQKQSFEDKLNEANNSDKVNWGAFPVAFDSEYE